MVSEFGASVRGCAEPGGFCYSARGGLGGAEAEEELKWLFKLDFLNRKKLPT